MMGTRVTERLETTVIDLPACSLQVVSASVLDVDVPYYMQVGAGIAGAVVNSDVLFAHFSCRIVDMVVILEFVDISKN